MKKHSLSYATEEQRKYTLKEPEDIERLLFNRYLVPDINLFCESKEINPAKCIFQQANNELIISKHIPGLAIESISHLGTINRITIDAIWIITIKL